MVTPCTPPIFPREAERLPYGEDWFYEFLWGGERIRALKEGDSVRLLAKDGRDICNRFPRVAAAVARLQAVHALIDGEVLLLDAYSPAAVRRLAHVSDDISQARVAFLAYDLLEHGTTDTRGYSLLCRRLKLATLLQSTPLMLSPRIYEMPEAALAEAAALGLSGVVAKRGASAYRPNATTIDWVKVAVTAPSATVQAAIAPKQVA